MHIFNYSFLHNYLIPTVFLNITAQIYTIREREENRKKNYPDIFTKLREIAVIQSVTASNAIEGIVSTDKRIAEIVNHNSAPLNHNEQEIAGYRDALNYIHTNYASLEINEKTVLYLHGLMLSHTGLTSGGHYKTSDNVIIERQADGQTITRWIPVSHEETGKAMEQLFNAYEMAKDDMGINQMLLIPCFILDFLCIHPFQDGNGRMSRLLTLLMLYKAGFDIPAYISFEEQVNKGKGYYYEALKASSVGWHETKNSYSEFIFNFLNTLYQCYKEMDSRFATIHSEKTRKNVRVREVVRNAVLPISKKEICDILPDVSPSTVEAVLSTMLKEGSIKKIGTTRNTRYISN